MASTFDFIVVGAGASGCVVASRLSNSASKPSVLLLEAGPPYESEDYLAAENRFDIAFKPNSFPNWGYRTTPQTQLSGQQVDYSRGKGLGGTTAINFAGWVVGSRDDYDEWARLVGDESFNWKNVKRCLDKVTRLHLEMPDPEIKQYLHVKSEDHSSSGMIDISYGGPWIPDVKNIYIAAQQIGMRINPDINSGDPIGLGMGAVSCYNGKRVTAATAYLTNPPPNLTIVTNAHVSKIVLEGKKAMGAQTVDGRSFSARNEVVVSGGALNSPQQLLLSGIGPRDELEKHGIPVHHELPLVGRTLRDHCLSSIGIVVKHGPEFEEDQVPVFPSPMAFLKSESSLKSQEYGKLSFEVQRLLQYPTVPSFEIATRHSHRPPRFLQMYQYPVKPDISFVSANVILENPQSTGIVTLRSSNPNDAPLFDPKFLTHPFDRRVMIEAIKDTLRLLKAPVYANKTIEVLGPKTESDDAIWEHIKRHMATSWHMSCTIRMGKDPETACVDSNFRVFGIERLRVVDLSVCPFVPNNHTQSTAYVLGEIAAEKLIKEYQLETLANRNVNGNRA